MSHYAITFIVGKQSSCIPGVHNGVRPYIYERDSGHGNELAGRWRF